MKQSAYLLKLSPQGQLTLPRDLRDQLHLQAGSRVVVTLTYDGALGLSDKPPIGKHFGTLGQLWTKPGKDAAEYARELRESMQPGLK